jgi:hypothetical protein
MGVIVSIVYASIPTYPSLQLKTRPRFCRLFMIWLKRQLPISCMGKEGVHICSLFFGKMALVSKQMLLGLSVSASWKTVVPNFSPWRKNSRNNPTPPPVMAAVHSNTTKRTTKLQTRRHYGRLFNPLFNRRTTALQTFIQWHQASAL